MRVFVAGATGAIGRPLVKRLVALGHQVTATTRSQGQDRSVAQPRRRSPWSSMGSMRSPLARRWLVPSQRPSFTR